MDVLGDLVGYYDPTPGGLSYVPLPPARVLDTRSGGGAPIGAGGVRTLTVAGAGGVPASGATAAVVNVTATQGTRVGYLQVFETGKPEPNTSIVDYGANQTIANLAIVPLSSDGRLTVVNHSSGTVHVLVAPSPWKVYGSRCFQ